MRKNQWDRFLNRLETKELKLSWNSKKLSSERRLIGTKNPGCIGYETVITTPKFSTLMPTVGGQTTGSMPLNINGAVCDNPQEIEDHIISYFKEVYTKDKQPGACFHDWKGKTLTSDKAFVVGKAFFSEEEI